MMTDAIEMQRKKTQKLLDLESFSSNDWGAAESSRLMLLWWASQETTEGVDWAWKILDRLVVVCSNKSVNENEKEIQARKKLLTDCLHSTINSWRLLVRRNVLAIRNDNDTQTSHTDCRESIEQARQLVPPCSAGCSDVQRDYRCNDYAYDAAINAWGNGQDPQRVARAQALLREMQQLHRSGEHKVRCLYAHLIDSSLDQK